MSHQLWKYYFQDDVESFVQLLSEAGIAGRSTAQRPFKAEQTGLSIGSPGGVAASPAPRHSIGYDARPSDATDPSQHGRYASLTLARADVNRRDGKGLTLLHHAASSTNENAKAFALSLIGHPLVDVHIQDIENGWTALHRAFYFGNITIARAILEREAQDAVGASGVLVQAASLVKTKDWEGNGPYDLLTATIGDRTLHSSDARLGYFQSDSGDEDEAVDNEKTAEGDDDYDSRTLVHPSIELDADEILTFGSNKNITLGLGNQDDRQFPERIALNRPTHLYKRFYRDHVERRIKSLRELSPLYTTKLRATLGHHDDLSALPATVRSKPIVIQELQMSKFHTAVLTSDPVSNLHICGHGFGGRLGVGDEKTRFNLVCVEDFGPSRKKIVAIALGQDHTLAVTDRGELFAWGSNTFGQLGLGLSKTSVNAEEPHQLVPKQIFGSVKREIIVGVAASRTHSVAHTSTALFTFGKNEGQLGIVDAHAGSLKIQSTPRRVAASRIFSAISSVCATDRATVCLLENHEVHVFANYGIVKLQFPLDQFANPLSEKSQTATRYDSSALRITKITCGGDTICALSNAGEIFAVTVDQRLDPGATSNTSTTNPNKIRDALSSPQRIWSLKKGHMSARDVAVDQDGSIIIATEAGNVWRRMRSVIGAKTRLSGQTERRPKEFKISRVPGLTRVIAVRASSSGAYGAVRSECDVTKTQIAVGKQTLWHEVASLLPFKNIAEYEDSETENPMPAFWTPRPPLLHELLATLARSADLEKDIDRVLRSKPNELCYNLDMSVGSSVSDVKIPLHAFILAGRSRYLRDAFSSVHRGNAWSDDLFTLEVSENGQIALTFKGIDFLSVIEFVLYMYTDEFVGFWVRSRDNRPELAFRYRQVRLELLKLASRFELQTFESAVRRMAHGAPRCLDKDLDLAVADIRFFEDGDASVQLADAEVSVHTDLLSMRCPFFKGLFQGRAGGRWLDERKGMLANSQDLVGVDMTHIDLHVFQLVLRHIYADVGEELFDEVSTKDLDEYLDLVLDVLSAANELMLDRLSQICQEVLGKYVTTRNVCQLLNAVAPSSVTEFKTSALEFICVNLEGILSNHLLDELEEDLLHELDDVVRDNQLNSLPIAKSGRAETILYDKYPHLAEAILKDKQAQLDWMRVRAKHPYQQARSLGGSLDPDSDDVFRSPRRALNARGTPGTSAESKSLSGAKARVTAEGSQSTTLDDGTASLASISPLLNPKKSSFNDPESPAQRAYPLGSPQLGFASGASNESNVTPQPSSITTTPHETSAAVAWAFHPLSSAKLSIKEIMNQASSSRTSNLSLGFASQDKTEERQKGSFQSKVSQKERRRQQQRHVSDGPPRPDAIGDASASSAQSSPWQAVEPKAKSATPHSATQTDKDYFAASTTSPSTRQPATPQLTMRQTIANSSSIVDKKASQKLQAPHTPKAQSNTPIAHGSAPTASPINQLSSPNTKPIEVQSIHHSPRTRADVSPTFHMHQSLADILSQQEAEKNIVKEAAVKRSLQEIQQEQEFQEWWDQESKRVMEEEAASARAAASRSRRDKGSRGGRSRGRRGKGKEKAVESSSRAEPET